MTRVNIEKALKSAIGKLMEKLTRDLKAELNHGLYELSLLLPNKARNGLKNKLKDVKLPRVDGKE